MTMPASADPSRLAPDAPPVRVAVLGAGRIGRVHAHNVATTPGCTLVGIADPVGTAAASLTQRYGGRPEADPSAFITDESVDAVVIGTPTDTHVELMLQAARHGKAVLCEKPIDLEIGRALAAAAEVERLGARVMVAFNRRFDPSAAALRQAIDEGGIGEVRQVVISSRDPEPPPAGYIRHSGGIFRDMAIHDFDMARFLLPDEPVEVVAMASCLVDPGIGALGDSDTAMILLRTRSGRQCHINCCRQAAYGHDQRLEIFGSRGMLLNDNLRASTVRRYDRDRTDSRERLLEFFLERYEQAYRNELRAFVGCVAAGRPMPVTVRDGIQALRIADAAERSVRTGRSVQVETA